LKNNPQKKITPDEELGILAMEFRGTMDDEQRRVIAGKYERILNQLLSGKRRREMPPLESQLPDEWMPKTFFEWLRGSTRRAEPQE
jgi:hypothetical protein